MDVQGLYDIYSFWHKPFWQTRWFMGLVLIIVGCVLTALMVRMFFFFKKRKKVLCWERAFKNIDTLKQQHFSDNDSLKTAYVTLTLLVKNYCYDRYAWPVKGFTDREFALFLQGKKVDSRLIHIFDKIVSRSESIKFAQGDVALDQLHADCALCEDFIRITIPSDK